MPGFIRAIFIGVDVVVLNHRCTTLITFHVFVCACALGNVASWWQVSESCFATAIKEVLATYGHAQSVSACWLSLIFCCTESTQQD